MNNAPILSHQAIYSKLAAENNLSLEEVEHAAQFFGNDFDSLETALYDMEPITIGDLT